MVLAFPFIFTVNLPGHPLPRNLISFIQSSLTSRPFSKSSRPMVDGVPAQKNAIDTPIFRSSSDLAACDILVPTTSHGFPMNTHGLGEDSIFFNPSHGE